MATAREAEVHDLEDEDPELEGSSTEPLLDRLETVGEKVTEFVIERPLTSVAIAAAVGFMFGRMMRR